MLEKIAKESPSLSHVCDEVGQGGVDEQVEIEQKKEKNTQELEGIVNVDFHLTRTSVNVNKYGLFMTWI